MANDPKKANQNRPPSGRKANAQAEHEGSSHKPEEFDVMNPARTEGKPDDEVQEQL